MTELVPFFSHGFAGTEGKGLSRLIGAPVGTPKRDAVRLITDSVLLDKRDPKYDQMVEEAKGIGALLSFKHKKKRKKRNNKFLCSNF